MENHQPRDPEEEKEKERGATKTIYTIKFWQWNKPTNLQERSSLCPSASAFNLKRESERLNPAIDVVWRNRNKGEEIEGRGAQLVCPHYYSFENNGY
jgi:hypothetical protein